ncbi:uncharacterized protein LOC114828297 [Galendromus occidentalis]|uniref:Uncharacterized protein LOC114828297 n=1 Tax=Galendromus occidentalis TaxID=34638 RepID=A0AAJ7SGM1_9ACAR|nr:uncharacterized protein LOC114828297 [Galendromus occidentalis]
MTNAERKNMLEGDHELQGSVTSFSLLESMSQTRYLIELVYATETVGSRLKSTIPERSDDGTSADTVMSVEVANKYVDDVLNRVAASLKQQGPYQYKYLIRSTYDDWFELDQVKLSQTHFLKRSGDVALFLEENPKRVLASLKLSQIEMKGKRLSTSDNELYCRLKEARVNITLLSDTKIIRGGNMRIKTGEVSVHYLLHAMEVLEFLKLTFRKYVDVFVRERLFKTLFHYVPQVAKGFGTQTDKKR